MRILKYYIQTPITGFGSGYCGFLLLNTKYHHLQYAGFQILPSALILFTGLTTNLVIFSRISVQDSLPLLGAM